MNEKYNSKLIHNSKQLRSNMTKEEKHLWYDFLKKLPVTVNRQKVIGKYIVDFYCASAKLVVELDGSQHYSDEGMESDKERDQYLGGLGITVKRYSNLELHRNFDAVCNDILNFIEQKQLDIPR